MFRRNKSNKNFFDYDEIRSKAMEKNLLELPKLDGDRFTKLDSYWLNKGFSKSLIYYDEVEENSEYFVINPDITEQEKNLKSELTKKLKNKLLKVDITGNKEEIFFENFKDVIKRVKEPISEEKFLRLFYYLKRDLINYGRLQPFLEDSYLEDISCNGANIPIFVYHQRHGDLETNVEFNEEELESLVMNIAERSNKRINFARPLTEATMPSGSRAQLSLGNEVTIKGSTITIRKFPEVPITPTDLIAWNTLSPEMMAYLWLLAEHERNIMIVGGTATGKTTTLNAMTLFIPWEPKLLR